MCISDAKNGISLHFIPFAGDDKPEPKRKGDASSGLTLSALSEQNGIQLQIRAFVQHILRRRILRVYFLSLRKRPRLTTDEIGIVPIPKYTNTALPSADDKPLSASAKRMVCKQMI